MNYRWSSEASRSWLKLIKDSKAEFGLKTARKMAESLDKKLERLVKNPDMGFPESLLAGRKWKYRSVIFSKNFKLIYFVADEVIVLADIWDMRMNPEKLTKRIKK